VGKLLVVKVKRGVDDGDLARRKGRNGMTGRYHSQMLVGGPEKRITAKWGDGRKKNVGVMDISDERVNRTAVVP